MLSASEAAAKRAALEQVMGPAAAGGRPAADLTLDDEVDCGSYVRFRASFATEPTCRTPAILCVPRPCLGASPERRPAALCLMGTDVDVGAMSLVGFSSRPNRAFASELAERGFVTLSPTYPLFPGYLDSPNSAAGATGLAKLGQTAEETEGFAALSELGYASGMRKAIHDNQVAIDCLAALDYVSMAAGVVCVGHSLGGHVCPHALPPHPSAPLLMRLACRQNALFTAAFEPRVSAVVTSCGFTRWRWNDNERRGQPGDLHDWTSPKCERSAP